MQINSDLGHILFLTYFFSLVIGGGGMIVIWLILTILMPQKLLDTYFKEPHFSQTELAFMSIWPGVLFRTAVFAWSVSIPWLHRKRKMLDCYKVMPRWYVFSLKIFTVISVTVALIILVVTVFIFSVETPVGA